MLTEKENKKISKFLSFVLRHNPDFLGIKLDENGWVKTSELLTRMHETGGELTMEQLEFIVATNSKKRFAFNDDKTMIRASQGHSVNIDLNIVPAIPPDILFHGTAEKYVEPILEHGILKGSRTHVHLSTEIETAITVGQRHGKIKIFEVEAIQMHSEGYLFYCSDNGVWLTEHVPVKFISLL